MSICDLGRRLPIEEEIATRGTEGTSRRQGYGRQAREIFNHKGTRIRKEYINVHENINQVKHGALSQ